MAYKWRGRCSLWFEEVVLRMRYYRFYMISNCQRTLRRCGLTIELAYQGEVYDWWRPAEEAQMSMCALLCSCGEYNLVNSGADE